MRRRCFLHPEVIAASRNFINVRINIWLNETNYKRLHTLIGSKYSGTELTANTAFCLFEPNAKGLDPESFPREPSVFFGSRVGCLYPTCISSKMDSPSGADKKYRVGFIKKRRLNDLGEAQVDPDLIKRIIWERENGADGQGLAKIMRDLSAKYPRLDSSLTTERLLPLMPTLRQAINFGTTDCRAVVAIVTPELGEDFMSKHMGRLLFEEGIAGRVHTARLTASEWASAKAAGLVKGGERSSGVMFLHPGGFGQEAQVHGEIAATANEQAIREGLARGLEEFARVWRKLDYRAHLKQGLANKITWREWDPVSKTYTSLSPKKAVPASFKKPKAD